MAKVDNLSLEFSPLATFLESYLRSKHHGRCSTTQSGKGILLTLLVTQAIARGETVICFDPKGSNRLKHAIESSAAYFHRRYYPIELRRSSSSQYGMNPLKHYARVSEIATRITNLIDDEGPFKNFAWSALYAVAGLTHALGKPMTLVEIKHAFERGLNQTILDAIRVYLEKLQYILTGNSVSALLLEDDRLIEAFENRHRQLETLSSFEKKKLRALEDAIERSWRFLKSPREYTEKIISNLYPVLEMLTSDTLQDILSVGTTDEDHSNPHHEVDLLELVKTNGVLYVATDALSDRTVAAALGDIFLSDLTAFAGSLYRNNQSKKCPEKKKVSVFIDECSNMMNDSLIELLNKGAEAGFEVTCAMQTVSDLTARLKSESKARMALGNFNNLIVLRTKDKITADFATEMFGNTSVEELTGTVSTGSTSADPQSVRAGYSKKIATRRDTLVPEEILSRLPDGEWFAILGGHDLIKGRTPILTFDR